MEIDSDDVGFPSILSCFYAVFHPTEGPKVVYQTPSASITPESQSQSQNSPNQQPLIDFDTVQNYIIPKPEICNRLITVKAGNYKIVSYPVYIPGSRYQRNFFIFNFGFVFAFDDIVTSYISVVKKYARQFKVLEEQNGFLSNEKNLDAIENLNRQTFEDLNNYCECMIPIDDSNTVDIKLFPVYPPPPLIKPFHVPISTVRLDLLKDSNWDPTMEKIIPFIDGVYSLQQIADKANADFNIVRKCIRHLMYYGCIMVINIFQFDNIYAPTADIGDFIDNPDIANECQLYVVLPNAPERPSTSELLYLYRSLHQGKSVRQWYMEHRSQLKYIDVRRFITFGVIKRIIYRVHRYPLFDGGPNSEPHHTLPPQIRKLARAPRHVDSLCTELTMSRSEMEKQLLETGGTNDWKFINS